MPLPPLAGAAPLLFAIGVLAGATGPFEGTVIQERVPPELRARVFALVLAAETLVVPPAVLPAGFLIAAAGLRAELLLFAVDNAALGGVIASRGTRRL